MTTEHFTLQGARTAAITESTSRATIFIGSVSAGLIALGLEATDVARMAGHANSRTTLGMCIGTAAGALNRAHTATQ